MLCDGLEGWDRGCRGRLKKEAIYVYFQLSHIVVQQKPAQHCKAITLELKKRKLVRLTQPNTPDLPGPNDHGFA